MLDCHTLLIYMWLLGRTAHEKRLGLGTLWAEGFDAKALNICFQRYPAILAAIANIFFKNLSLENIHHATSMPMIIHNFTKVNLCIQF